MYKQVFKIKFIRWKYIPFFSKYAFTIYPYIYLPKQTFEDLRSNSPSPQTLATLAHEQVHLKRQWALGIVKYSLLYLFSRKFRFEEEMVAIKAQMQELQKHGVDFDTEARARLLSSAEYLWCVNFIQAKIRLEKEKDLIYAKKTKAGNRTN